MRRISVPSSIDMVNVLGPRDEFLRILERELDADIHVRGNEVTLTGSGLRRIELALQRLNLSYIACLPPRCHSVVTDDQPAIRQIVVTQAKDAESPTAILSA